MDQPGKTANVLSRDFQESLARALDLVESRPEVRGLVLSSAKPKIFVAGADLNAIVDTLDWSDSQIEAFCEYGRRLYQRFQEGPWTSVAAVHGACVGGGLELALGCDWRIAADDPKTLLGLPETKLGLIPGWAGTVRLPRMMELDRAIELIAGSQLFDAGTAHGLGLVDQLVPADQLLETAMNWALDPLAAETRAGRRALQLGPARTAVDDPENRCRVWSDRVRRQPGIHPFAPDVLAHHMIRSSGLGFEAACQSEARAMSVVYGSPPSRGLLNHYFLTEKNRRSPGWPPESLSQAGPGNGPRQVRRVGIVGCGLMGQAISRLMLAAGLPVTVRDLDPARAAGFASTNAELVSVADNWDDFSRCDFVIEAIAEDMDRKKELLAGLSRALPPAIALASNTSTISISRMAESVVHPGRFCGVHFCHPQLLDLVEIVPGEKTGGWAVEMAQNWLRGMGKATVVVRDSPGFVVNRLLMGMVDAALSLIPEGVDWVQIDSALRNFGMLGGPFEMIDEIGVDTVVAGGRSMALAGGGTGRRVVPALPRMARRGNLGRKSGAGFYLYNSGSERGPANPAAIQLLADCRGPASGIDDTSICQRILAGLLVSATALIDEGVASDPRDIDFCLIRGLGFPAHQGGILFWADQMGQAAVAELFDTLDAGFRHSLPKALTRWFSGNSFFYPHGTRTHS